MDTKNKKATKISLQEYVNVCLGIILVCLTIVGITNQTGFGRFLTYCFSYAFGLFYPFFFAFLVFLGLHLVLRRHFFPVKGYGSLWIGILLVTLGCLGFGSFSFIVENQNLAFTDVLGLYDNRMLAFAPTRFYPDNFASLGGLGGGFVGLFLVGLFGSVIKSVGAAILFVLMLLFGIALISYKPVKAILADLKKKRENRVTFESTKVKTKSLDDPKERQAVSQLEERPALKNPKLFTKRLELEEENAKDEEDSTGFAQGGFSFGPSTDDIFAKPVSAAPSPLSQEPAAPVYPPIEEAKEEETPSSSVTMPVESSKPQGGFGSFDFAPTQKKPIETTPKAYQASETIKAKDDYHLSDEMEALASQRAKAFRESATGPERNVYEVSTSPETLPSFNPLEEQAKRVKSLPTQPEVRPNEFVVDNPEKEIPMEAPSSAPAEKKEETEEEMEARLTQEYFLNKAQLQIQKQKQAEEARQKELENVMRYVSRTGRTYNYHFPDDSLLEEHDDSDKLTLNSESAMEKSQIINKVFQDFGFPAKAVSFTVGSSFTRFDIQTEPGVKSDKIESYLSELQIALKGDQSVRIQTVVEGKTTSGIEVGNKSSMAVSFKSMFMEIEKNTTDNLLIPIGKDVAGNCVTFPLDKMPHLLVAGTTGSGKSVLVNCMIMTLIMRNYPSQLKLMLIDPKQVEFAKYDMEPHLYCPVIQDAETAINALGKLCQEMDRRYGVLKNNSVVKMSEYRAKRVGHESEMEEIPDVVCVIDEFADLMNTGGDEIAGYVQRLTQKSRAAGIYLIIATQRPSKDAIPMIIKANITCRIGLACSSQVDSRVILDENGCEALVGKGDLLFKNPAKKNLIRCQSAFISDEETDRVLDYLKKCAGDPNYDSDFIDLKPKKEEEFDENQAQEDVYEEVKDFVMRTGFCSKSSIVVNFNQTSARADQILLKLRQESIVMPAQAGKYIVLKRRAMGE